MLKIQTEIDSDELAELVVERLEYWDKSDYDTEKLYKDYFEELAYNGLLDNLPNGLECAIDDIILNDTHVSEEGDDDFSEALEEFENSGAGGRILAVNDEHNPTALLLDDCY